MAPMNASIPAVIHIHELRRERNYAIRIQIKKTRIAKWYINYIMISTLPHGNTT